MDYESNPVILGIFKSSIKRPDKEPLTAGSENPYKRKFIGIISK